ncbi:MAG: Rieske 2Fe-2S domain-containing protein [Ferruginibacter sp.]
MQRRDFLKGACKICLLGAVVTTVTADLSSCSPKVAGNTFKPVVNNNELQVPLSLFENQPFKVISPANYEYEIAVEKKSDNSFKALLLKCTHYDNQLTTTGNGYTCSQHGSKFDKEGTVLKGPAENPLKQLKTQIIKDSLLIHL